DHALDRERPVGNRLEPHPGRVDVVVLGVVVRGPWPTRVADPREPELEGDRVHLPVELDGLCVVREELGRLRDELDVLDAHGEPGVRQRGDVEPEIGVLGLGVHAVGAERADGPVPGAGSRARAREPLGHAVATAAVVVGRAAAGPPDDVPDLEGPHRPGVLVARGDVGPEAEPVAEVVEAVLEGRPALAVGLRVHIVDGIVARPADHSSLPVECHGERWRGSRLRPRRGRRSEDHGAGREEQSDSLHPVPPIASRAAGRGLDQGTARLAMNNECGYTTLAETRLLLSRTTSSLPASTTRHARSLPDARPSPARLRSPRLPAPGRRMLLTTSRTGTARA